MLGVDAGVDVGSRSICLVLHIDALLELWGLGVSALLGFLNLIFVVVKLTWKVDVVALITHMVVP